MSDDIPAKRQKRQGEPCLAEGCIETQYYSEDPENEISVDVPSCSGQNTTKNPKKKVGKAVIQATSDSSKDDHSCELKHKHVDVHRADNQESLENTTLTCSRYLESEGDRLTGTIRDVADEEKRSIKELFNIHQSRELLDLKETLVQYNLSENSTLTLGPFFQKENPDLHAFYIPPTLSIVLPMRLASGNSRYRKEPITSLEQLLNPLDKRKKITCITSNAGLGKTSFCKFLARLWCAVQRNDNHYLEQFQMKADYLKDVDFLRKFNYLFFVSLKDVESNNVKFEDIIFSHLRNKIDNTWENENNRRILQKELKEKHCLLILDGLDESHMSKIMHPLPCMKYSIIFTSRPWKLGALGMSTATYREIQLEEMNIESAKQLLTHANVCLNSQSETKQEISEFFTVLKEQNLEGLLPNPQIALQLLCLNHDGYKLKTTGTKHVILGKTRTHIYANVVDMMLKLAVEREPECFKAMCDISNESQLLPMGFDEAEICNIIPSFVFSLGKLAFHDMMRQSETEMPERFLCQYLPTEKKFILASGLISGSASNRFSEKSMVYTFLHKTYQEMLACVYISTKPLNSAHWDRFESYFKANLSPDMMSFLCVMNNEQGMKCLELYSSIERNFYKEGLYHENELISYQNGVLMAHQECINSGIPKPDIVLKHIVIDRKNNKEPPSSLVTQNMHRIHTLHLKSSEQENDLDVEFREIEFASLRTLIITGNNEALTLETLTKPSTGHLRFLFINNVELKQKQVDLTGCKQLSFVELENVCFSSVCIRAENLEKLWLYFNIEFRQTMPPAELRLHGKFSATLKTMSVMHVKLNTHIDLSDCVNLQKLILQQVISSPENNAKCVQTFNHLSHLKSLRLESLKYPTNVTLDFSRLNDLETLMIADLEVEKAIIAAEKLKELWVRQQIGNTIIVTVTASSNFTNNLEKLSLCHVKLNGHFDLSQSIKLKEMVVYNVSTDPIISVLDVLANCNEIEKLRIEALNSFESKELDMSHMTNLKCLQIDVQTLNVQIVNIPIANLENIWTYTSEPKQQIRPTKELHLPEHAQFNRNIGKLSLVNVQMNETDLSMCENLSVLRVDKMSQSVLETVCPHAVKQLYLVNVADDRMGTVFKAKEWIRLTKLSFERCEQHVILSILNDASALKELQLVRFKNTLVANTVDQFTSVEHIVDQCTRMRIHEIEFEQMSLPDTTFIDIANQLSKYSKPMTFILRDIKISSTNIEDVFAKLKNICKKFKMPSPTIKDERVETGSYQLDHLRFEMKH